MTIHIFYFPKLKSSQRLKIELINFWDMTGIHDLYIYFIFIIIIIENIFFLFYIMYYFKLLLFQKERIIIIYSF